MQIRRAETARDMLDIFAIRRHLPGSRSSRGAQMALPALHDGH